MKIKPLILATAVSLILTGCAFKVKIGDHRQAADAKKEVETKEVITKVVKNENPSTSNNSGVRNYVVKDKGKGELHYVNTNGKGWLKFINQDGKMAFDGPLNTREEKSKVPAEAMHWLEEVLEQAK
jgi:hypothetical protein